VTSRSRHLTLAFLLAALLVACSTSGNYHNDAAHKELLQTLRQCLVQVSLQTSKEGFQSPCVNTDVSSLNGISRGQLTGALGPPQYCASANGGGFPKEHDCPLDQNPQWSFYHLPQGVFGGGPELVCESQPDDRRHCLRVAWRRSQ
jgi:hypothetical protein